MPSFFRHVPPLIRAIFAIFLVVSVGACTPQPKNDGSILLITVPGLRADDLECTSGTDSLTPQMDSICNEGVRFTHAYTPSVLSVPALASVLTGLYPAEHQIHRNGTSQFPEGVHSVAQEAADRGYETLFVAGGAPFLRKIAVSKGFLDFDDSIRFEGGYFRPAKAVVGKFFDVLEHRSEGPLFGVVEFSDLSFPEAVTPKSQQQGEHVEGSYNGKLQEIDDAVGLLKTYFSKRKAWDPLTVVIVGLQGRSKGEHDNLSWGLNLYDEVVRVPLIVKPSRKPRDLAPSWKVDVPVSLVDLGATLSKMFSPSYKKESRFQVVDLSDAFAARDIKAGERPIFAESDLPPWRNWGPRIVSARQGEWVYWTPPDPKLFNTYTDHLQLHNLYSIEYNAFSVLDRVWHDSGKVLRGDDVTPAFMPFSISEKLRITKILFSKTSAPQEKLHAAATLQMRRPDDWQAYEWTMSLLVDLQDWPGMSRLVSNLSGETFGHERELKLWRIFAALKSKGRVEDIKLKVDATSACLLLASSLKRLSVRELESLALQQACADSETQYWLNAYVNQKLKKPREAAAFLELAHSTTEKRLEQIELARAFWMDGATWDYVDTLPGGPAVLDLFLAIASGSEFQNFVKKKPAL